MTKLKLFIFLSLFCLTISCKKDKDESFEKEIIIKVDAKKVYGTGINGGWFYQVIEEGKGSYVKGPKNITGFDEIYQEGYEYNIKVLKSCSIPSSENVQDVLGGCAYTYIETQSKEKIINPK